MLLHPLCTEKLPAFGSSIGNAPVVWNGVVEGKVYANGEEIAHNSECVSCLIFRVRSLLVSRPCQGRD